MRQRVVKTRSVQDFEKLINKMTTGKTFELKNWQEVRSFDAQNDDAQKLAYAFATLVNELKQRGIF